MQINCIDTNKKYSHEEAIELFIALILDMDGKSLTNMINEMQNHITISYLQDSLWQSSIEGSTRLMGSQELFDFFRKILDRENTLIDSFEKYTDYTLSDLEGESEFTLSLSYKPIYLKNTKQSIRFNRTYPYGESEYPCFEVSSGIYHLCIDYRPVAYIKTDPSRNNMVFEESKLIADVAIDSYLKNKGKYSIYPTPYFSVIDGSPVQGKTIEEYVDSFKGVDFDIDTMIPCITNIDEYNTFKKAKNLLLELQLPGHENEVKFNIWDSELIERVKREYKLHKESI